MAFHKTALNALPAGGSFYSLFVHRLPIENGENGYIDIDCWLKTIKAVRLKSCYEVFHLNFNSLPFRNIFYMLISLRTFFGLGCLLVVLFLYFLVFCFAALGLLSLLAKCFGFA